MLRISVSVHRKFDIPCDLPGVEAHFSDFGRMLEDLPALTVSRVWGPHQYRICYSANIAGVYQVDLFSDVQARFTAESHALVVSPLRGITPVAAQATLQSLTGQGDYSSRLVLSAKEHSTVATYDITIAAEIPKPARLSLLPDAMARMAVQAVVQRRVQELADVFIARTLNRLSKEGPTSREG
jgi:hypothetical protein